MKAEYVNHMGDDLMVANSARVSFDKASQWNLWRDDDGVVRTYLKPRDENLIRYLATHSHWTPFAHPQITLRMTAPVFVRTQCFKHKVGFTENEVSRRYVDSEPEFFSPRTGWRGRSASAKQGSSDVLPRKEQVTILRDYDHAINTCLETYEWMLDKGVCPEQARMVLPQSMMTQWYWTGSLAAYARFVRQRTDPHAQQEVRDLARMVGDIIEPLFPVSWKYLVGAVNCTEEAA